MYCNSAPCKGIDAKQSLKIVSEKIIMDINNLESIHTDAAKIVRKIP